MGVPSQGGTKGDVGNQEKTHPRVPGTRTTNLSCSNLLLVLGAVVAASCSMEQEGTPWRFEPTLSVEDPRTWAVSQPPPLGVVHPGGDLVLGPGPTPVWEESPCRFLVATQTMLEVVSCGGAEPNIQTRVAFRVPNRVLEVEAQDWTNLWVVTMETLFSVRMDTAEVSPSTVPLPRRDWRAALRRHGNLLLVDSGGEVWEVRGGETFHISDLVFPEGVRVHGDGTWSTPLNRALVLLRREGTREPILGSVDPRTGEVLLLGEEGVLHEDSSGVAETPGGWVWVTGVSHVHQVNPLTGEVRRSWVTGQGGPMAGTLAPPTSWW